MKEVCCDVNEGLRESNCSKTDYGINVPLVCHSLDYQMQSSRPHKAAHHYVLISVCNLACIFQFVNLERIAYSWKVESARGVKKT